MPSVSGYDVLAYTKKLIPNCINVSVTATNIEASKYSELGFDYFMVKPIEVEAMKTITDKIFNVLINKRTK